MARTDTQVALAWQQQQQAMQQHKVCLASDSPRRAEASAAAVSDSRSRLPCLGKLYI